MKRLLLPVLVVLTGVVYGQAPFNGVESNLGNLYRLSPAKTRSISPENLNGARGAGGMATTGTGSDPARDLGPGWKLSPSVDIKSGETFTIAEIEGPGSIQHIWMTPTGNWRYSILRFYWDDETTPSVEVPVGDFFGMGWGQYAPLRSLAICVNPGSAFNCYWPMPFRKRCRITLENLDTKAMTLYFQVDYILTEIPRDAAYFHAQFRRVNPLPYKQPYVLLDSVRGKGQYVGTYLAWGVHNDGWWGEGEIKFYLDGDTDYPTICGTGTEDYFCGSYDFDTQTKNSAGVEESHYTEFNSPYSGSRPGHSRRWALQCLPTFRPLPLAYYRPDPVRQRPQSDDPGPGLARRRAILAAARRYQLHRILVPNGAACALPQTAGEGSTGN